MSGGFALGEDRAAQLWQPNRLSLALRGWWRADTYTLSATLRATSGTTPPVVTLSGTLTVTDGMGFRMEIQTTGARGTATFRYSRDNGASWIESNVVTAATYAMVGPLTGRTLVFPVGLYTNNNVYEGAIGTWEDLSGNGFTMNAGGQPRCKASWSGGKPAMLFDITKTENFTETANNVVLTAGSAYAVISFAQASTTGGALFSTRATTRYWVNMLFTTGGVTYVSGNGVDGTANCTIADPTPAKLSPFWMLHQNNGSTVVPTYYFNGAAKTQTNSGVSQITETGTTGAQIGTNGANQRWSDYIAEIIVTTTGTLTANDRARLAAYAKSRYGI